MSFCEVMSKRALNWPNLTKRSPKISKSIGEVNVDGISSETPAHDELLANLPLAPAGADNAQLNATPHRTVCCGTFQFSWRGFNE